MRQRGFSAIEMMVVLMIIATLAALATPSVSAFIAEGRLRSAAMDLLTDLYYARSEAVRLNIPVTVTSISGSNWAGGWTVTCAGTPNPCKNGAPPLRQRVAYSGIQVAANTATFSYSVDGRLDAFAQQVFIVQPASTAAAPEWVKNRCVNIDISGRPSIVVDKDNNRTNGC